MDNSITRTAADKARPIDPGRFIDLVAFWLGVGAFQKMKGDGHPQMIAGVRLLRRFQPEMVEGIQKYLLPLTKSPAFARFKAPLAIAMRSSTQLDQALYQTEILTDIFQLLRSKQTQLHSIFLDSRSAPVAMKVATLASSDSPETILSGLAVLPPASSLQVSRGWLRTAAEEAGMAPTETETVMADSEAARSLGVDLHQVEVQLAQADPMSTYEMDLQEQKQRLLGHIDTIAKNSANPPVVLATAAVAVTQPRDFATNVGRAQRLSPDQERSMMIRGKGLIAAGAGSGKTRVLAAKVVYHMNELGAPAQSIMATSFSKKSAAELLKRIEDFGAVFPQGTDRGLGTTHSVASKLMRDYGGDKASRDGLQKFEPPILVRLAMKQVQMGGAESPPPAPSSMFAETQAGLTAETQAGLTFEGALNQAYQNRGRLSGFLLKFLYGFFNPNDDWYHRNRKSTRNLTDPFGLSEKQQNILLDVFSFTGVTYDPDSDPLLQQQGSGKTAAKKVRDKDKGLREKFPSFSRPVGQWFNLGLHLTEDGTDKGKPLPSGHFKQAITKYKGRLISPSEAWALAKVEDTSLAGLGSSEAAVYAAYEFLKGPSGELDFRGKGDFDDVLIDASKMLLANPKVLRQVQSRFKTVLVDEAQDLNRSQHLMFGLISGFVDPAKVPKIAFVTQFAEIARDDGGMTADTYCFIGDDKQAIYEFRGADPDTFIGMSDMVEGGAGFKTEVLKTNYRSGKNIVDAANQLISHNSRQIPMVCDANPSRVSQGGITRVPFAPVNGADMSEPAMWLATHIKEMMEIGEADKGYSSFGVGLRSNAESYTYGIELLKKGIPFRSNTNFFSDKNTQAILYWLTLADEGLDGNQERINDAVLNARSAPVSMLGDKFVDKVTEQATGNYIVWLQANWASVYGPRSNHSANVKAYLDNLLLVTSLKAENLSNENLLDRLLVLQGYDGSSVADALIDKVLNDAEAVAELESASPDGEISDDDVRDQAFAPIAPLKSLMGARSNLAEAMNYVRTLQNANAKLAKVDDPNAPDFNQPAVTLNTMHSWKGLEVPNMFIPIVGGRFPRTGSSKEDLASERRLGYVAITRGENHVYVMDIPTVKIVNEKAVVIRSPFVGEMCIPTSKPTTNKTATEEPSSLPPGMSAHDPDLMNAYLRGEDPLALARQKYLKETQRGAVVAALAKGRLGPTSK